jgi:predicted TPR repeat methyltransferase
MHLTFVAQVLRELRPQSVLDIGTGFGMYGFLARDYLDVYEGRPHRNTWKVRIEGVEAWPEYVTPVHHHIYDALHVGEALQILDSLGGYEMVAAGDVIEHLQRDDSEKLIQKMIAHAQRWVVLSVPLGNDWPQDVSHGNPFQAHRSVWRGDELESLGFVLKEFRDECLRPYAVGIFTHAGAKPFDMGEVRARELWLAAHRRLPVLSVVQSGIRHLLHG